MKSRMPSHNTFLWPTFFPGPDHERDGGEHHDGHGHEPEEHRRHPEGGPPAPWDAAVRRHQLVDACPHTCNVAAMSRHLKTNLLFCS